MAQGSIRSPRTFSVLPAQGSWGPPRMQLGLKWPPLPHHCGVTWPSWLPVPFYRWETGFTEVRYFFFFENHLKHGS